MAINESSPYEEGMEKYMNRGIKDVITEHPELEAILGDYDIGCGACMVGTCLLKDIVDVHGLPSETERALMGRITKVIYPNAEIEPSEDDGKAQAERTFAYSPPVQILVDEHKLIKRLIALIPCITESMDLTTEDGRQLVLDGVDFIKTYADSFHHAKEEDLLFKYFDEDSEIVSAFHEDHRVARREEQGKGRGAPGRLQRATAGPHQAGGRDTVPLDGQEHLIGAGDRASSVIRQGR